MSKCCGLQAYNPLNEICCNLTVSPKPSHDAKCCDKQPYDKKQKVCCGGKKVLTRLSPDHHCCYESLFDSSIEECCQDMFPRIQLKTNDSVTCVKKLASNSSHLGQSQGGGVKRWCSKNVELKHEEVCCASEAEEVVYHGKEGFKCCGHHYYNPALWVCNAEKLRPIQQLRYTNNGFIDYSGQHNFEPQCAETMCKKNVCCSSSAQHHENPCSVHVSKN
ncbi:galaxin [Fundulus heteroclitus]|uniref:galaxin n=1 Tax=Fundulus heteroclitus TaxID=8078 RepID=UPI00165C891F|nr:galaxin [Fundulus heteroclitus]